MNALGTSVSGQFSPRSLIVTVSRGLVVWLAAFVFASCGSKTPASPTTSVTSKLAPALESPADGAAVSTFRPTLTVRNSTEQGGARLYEFQVSDRSDFSNLVVRRASV